MATDLHGDEQPGDGLGHGALRAVGVGSVAEEVYRALLDVPPGTCAALGERMNRPLGEVIRAVDELEGLGLVSRRVADAVEQVRATSPRVAIEVLLLQRTERLEQARLWAAGLTDTYRSGRLPRDASDVVDVVTGQEAVSDRVAQLTSAAQVEVLLIAKGPHARLWPPAAATRMAAARGVAHRSICDHRALDDARTVSELVRHGAQGGQVRALPRVPGELVIADRSTALVPQIGRGDEHGAVGVHTGALVDALLALFEHLWLQATELRLALADSDDAPADTEALVSLLLAGLPDDAIARRLDTSTRTVQRRVRALMADVGAANRLQLGYQLARTRPPG